MAWIDQAVTLDYMRDGYRDVETAACVLAEVEPRNLSADDLRRMSRAVGVSDDFTFEEEGILFVDGGVLRAVLTGERVARFELSEDISCTDRPER
ncbi:MAG: hypothetical protein AAF938_00405 [Myxococcota bacterium]